MASLMCPECGKELLAEGAASKSQARLCSHCGRETYERTKTEIKARCSKCGEKIDTVIISR